MNASIPEPILIHAVELIVAAVVAFTALVGLAWARV